MTDDKNQKNVIASLYVLVKKRDARISVLEEKIEEAERERVAAALQFSNYCKENETEKKDILQRMARVETLSGITREDVVKQREMDATGRHAVHAVQKSPSDAAHEMKSGEAMTWIKANGMLLKILFALITLFAAVVALLSKFAGVE